MFSLDDKKIRSLERDLKTFASRALPFATKDAINSTAFKAREKAQENIRSKMINRNKWSADSVKVKKAHGLNIDRQMALTGSFMPYMETQEFGGVKAGGVSAVPIATSYSAGREGSIPRKKLPKVDNRLRNIKLSKRKGVDKGLRKLRNTIRIKRAQKNNDKFVYLETRRSKGIFEVVGKGRGSKIKMVWSLDRKSVTISRNPWLKPAVDKAVPFVGLFYRKALLFQLRRHRLFK